MMAMGIHFMLRWTCPTVTRVLVTSEHPMHCNFTFPLPCTLAAHQHPPDCTHKRKCPHALAPKNSYVLTHRRTQTRMHAEAHTPIRRTAGAACILALPHTHTYTHACAHAHVCTLNHHHTRAHGHTSRPVTLPCTHTHACAHLSVVSPPASAGRLSAAARRATWQDAGQPDIAA